MKYYKLCLNKNFSKGIKSKILCCVILYSICRLNKINILLIEFSNIIKINLFKLGTIYIKFIKLFDLNIPLLDSSLILKK
jgi:transcription factor IIIB subunit 2